MDYLGQSGDKALVNDRGRILRLPFAGDGKPPEPGTRINPNRDSCCCPKNVNLIPGQDEERNKPNPRRTVVTTDTLSNSNRFIGFNLDKQSFELGFIGASNNIEGKGNKKFLEINNGGCYIYQEDTIFFPLSKKAFFWDFSKRKLTLRSLERKKILYVWSEGTYGTAFPDKSQKRLRDLAKKQFNLDVSESQIIEPIKNYPVIIKVLDTARRGYSDSNGNILKDRQNVNLFKNAHPEGQFWAALEAECDLETLKLWFRNPEHKRFKYERLY